MMSRPKSRALRPAAVTLVTVGLLALVAAPVRPTQAEAPAYAPGEVVVEFKPGTSDAERAAAVSRIGARRVKRLRTQSGNAERVSTGRPVPEAVQVLNDLPSVELAEPNWIYTTDAISNDPGYTGGSLWGMYGDASPLRTNAYGSQAGEAWANGSTGSATVYVGVIDEGIDVNHQDLAPNIWSNAGEIAGDGIDNDGNGYIDDLVGWDFYHNDSSVYDTGEDTHGTHVAGTIGAAGGNGVGVAGVCWDVRLISAKFLGPGGGYMSDAIEALDYLTDLKLNRGVNVVATNNSWTGGGFSQLLLNAITRGANAGILFVGAAGNSGTNNDKRQTYPCNYNTTAGAGYDAVISVAAIASNGSRPRWSNYGAATVDIGAPGAGIVSTYPNNQYASFDGTSMAAPHVTGGIALYAATHPLATPAQIRSAVLTSGVPTSSLSGKTVTGKRLNVSGF